MHQFPDAAFALGKTHFAVKVLAGDNVGRRLGPVCRNFNVALFKNNRPFVIADSSGAGFPGNFVVRGTAPIQPGREVPVELNSLPCQRNTGLHHAIELNLFG